MHQLGLQKRRDSCTVSLFLRVVVDSWL